MQLLSPLSNVTESRKQVNYYLLDIFIEKCIVIENGIILESNDVLEVASPPIAGGDKFGQAVCIGKAVQETMVVIVCSLVVVQLGL